jgi:branched-chain amino acid transport system ATP-binding protein
MDQDVAVRVEGLAAGYGGTPAVHGIDLVVTAGEIVTLLGANGAGKTTTLLAIAGELPAMRGCVAVLGQRRRRSLDQLARRGLGFLPEGRSVVQQLTGRENLELGRGGVDEALAYFPELESHLGKKAGLLSGGQQQMLSLGRILAGRPRVVLADELSLGLAPLVVSRLLGALRTAADAGVAVLLVEQHIRHALQVADRGCVLRRGRIVLEGSADELLASTGTITEHYLAGE